MPVPDSYEVLPGHPPWEFPECGVYIYSGVFDFRPRYTRTVDGITFDIMYFPDPGWVYGPTWMIVRNYAGECDRKWQFVNRALVDNEKPNCGPYHAYPYDPWVGFVNIQIAGERAGALANPVPQRRTAMVGY